MLSIVEYVDKFDTFEICLEQSCPFKVSLFVWRFSHNQLPMKDNLIRRIIIFGSFIFLVVES